MKLTDKTIDTIRLPAGKAELIEYDSEIGGFGLRVRQGGKRVFIYQYRIGSKNRRLTLGAAVKEAFPDIRKRVIELQAQVRLGQDPAAAKEVARMRVEVETFKDIADRYLAKQAKVVRTRTYKEDQRNLLVKAKRLHDRPIATIVRRDIAELLSATVATVTKGTGESTANRLRTTLSAMFSWAMREGLVESNPVTGTNKRNESARERVLSISELVEIWHALPDNNFGAATKLLMLTGQRRSEVGGLKWSELNDDLTLWTLPKERSKNHHSHTIPLSDVARDILTHVHRSANQDTVFGCGKQGMGNWSGGKAELDKRLQLKAWVMHDLRRSAATHMADLQVQPHIIECVLGHLSGFRAGVAGTYNRHPYEAEKRQALTLWAEHLMSAVSGKSAKIVPIRVA
jgi:integrase